jgi:hypothetical protein
MNAKRQVDFEFHFEGRVLQPGQAPRFLVALKTRDQPLNADADISPAFAGCSPGTPGWPTFRTSGKSAVRNHFVIPRGRNESGNFQLRINAKRPHRNQNDLYLNESRSSAGTSGTPRALELYGLGGTNPGTSRAWPGA